MQFQSFDTLALKCDRTGSPALFKDAIRERDHRRVLPVVPVRLQVSEP
jgi:hypothetical protein